MKRALANAITLQSMKEKMANSPILAVSLPAEDRVIFKWIKERFWIKSCYWTSQNAVKTQIWITISVYAVVAIIKKKLKV